MRCVQGQVSDLFKFWSISDNILEMAQDRDTFTIEGYSNLMWPIEWHQYE